MSNFDSNIIKNPEIFEQNRLAAHAYHTAELMRGDIQGVW